MSLKDIGALLGVAGLSDNEFRVLLVLAYHKNPKNGDCFPSLHTIAQESQKSVSTVQRLLTKLQARRYVRWRSGGNHLSNSYELLCLEVRQIADRDVTDHLVNETDHVVKETDHVVISSANRLDRSGAMTTELNSITNP